MSVEEKAKAYDKAVEQAEKEILACGSLNCDAARLIFRLFPDFKESEGERMSNIILEGFKNYSRSFSEWNDVPVERIIAYLERQKEHVPENEESGTRKEGKHIGISPIFKVGDIIERKDGLGTHLIINCISGNFYGCRKLVYQEWDTPFCEIPFKNQDLFQLFRDFEQRSWEWSEEETKLLDSIIDDYEKAAKSFCGYDGKIGLLRAIRDGEYNLPKPAWNEEDEQFLLVCKNALRKYQISDHWDANIISKWLEERIKSLCPGWKPSEEQMKALIRATNRCVSPKDVEPLMSLYNDLKKL